MRSAPTTAGRGRGARTRWARSCAGGYTRVERATPWIPSPSGVLVRTALLSLPFIVVSYLSIIIPSYYSILLFTFFTPCLLPLSFLSFSFQSFNFFSFLLSFVLLIFMFFFLQLLDLTEFNNVFIYLFVCLFIYDIIFPHSTLTV